MNINPEFKSPERPNAIEAMEYGMDFIFEEFIEPAKDYMTIENAEILTTIGIIFKDIAEKAEAYYTLREKGYESNENSLN